MNSSSLNRNLKAACAAAAVATSWGASQQSHAATVVIPTGISGTIAPTTHGLTHVYLFYATSSSGYDQVFALPNAPAGQTTPFYVETGNLPGYSESYAIMGVYGDGLVSISLSNDNAVGFSFDDVFDGTVNYDEQSIADALVAGTPGERYIDGTPANLAQALAYSYGTYSVVSPRTGMSAEDPGTAGMLISFSDGAIDGSTSAFESIPEPSGAALLGLGGMVLLFRRRAK